MIQLSVLIQNELAVDSPHGCLTLASDVHDNGCDGVLIAETRGRAMALAACLTSHGILSSLDGCPRCQSVEVEAAAQREHA